MQPEEEETCEEGEVEIQEDEETGEEDSGQQVGAAMQVRQVGAAAAVGSRWAIYLILIRSIKYEKKQHDQYS